MNEKNMAVLVNIIGAVEGGGQIYGNLDYAAYADPYTNSNTEHTITLGWAQNYGSQARELVQKIHDRDPAAFAQIDTAGIEKMLKSDWEAIRWKPTAAQKKVLIKLIDSAAGHACQDAMCESWLNTYIEECERRYTKDVRAVMMYCEIRHLGGYKPANRIFDRLEGNYSLDMILASLARDQQDKSNDNQVGDEKYWTRHLKCREFINKYSVEEGESMAVRVANCGHDENNRYSGGKAGDQTGTEWYLRAWYDYNPWNFVLRWKDQALANLFADLAIEAAENNNVGYDQGQRTTFGDALESAGWRPSKINIACETDCSKGTIDLIHAVGHLKGITELQNCNATYTGDMMVWFQSADGKKYFDVLTGKVLTDSSFARRGDINLNTDHHVNITVDNGVNSGASPVDNSLIGDCSVTLHTFLVGAKDPEIRAIQRILRNLKYKGKDKKALQIDGELGENTAYAIAKFQRDNGMKDINFGTVAAATWKLLLNA